MNIVLTGASGQFGTRLQAQWPEHAYNRIPHQDITADSVRGLRASFRASRVDALIHAAANTDLEAAETAPDPVWRDNVMLTQILLDAARDVPLKFVYLSSTGVYGEHKATPYDEFDLTLPTTVHHRTKLEAERLVRSQRANHLILRTGWLFGAAAQQPRNFVLNRLREARAVASLRANGQQRGNPTYLPHLIDAIAYLLGCDLSGTYNAVSEGVVTRAEFVAAIVADAGMTCAVEPASFPRRAPVSDNESGRNRKLELLGYEVPAWRAALPAYVAELWPSV
jgi:dTDP-4-dehydrorhamnose reductase